METAAGSILLLDGAMGTELERRGVNTALPLWSAHALLEAPEVVEQIHVEYLEAGAEAITTNTFRTHRRSLAKGGFGDRARELTFRAVEIAIRARERVNSDALVIGSIAPLEDCYRPDLVPGVEECRDEHAEMISHLVEAGVDLIAMETMNSMRESTAAIEQVRAATPGKWMASFCVKTDGPPGVMLRGSTLADMIPELTDAYAVGINCIPAASMDSQLKLLRALLPEGMRLAAYANGADFCAQGQCIGGAKRATEIVNPQRYAEYAESWVQAGVSILGGCCGTTPETIRAIAERLRVEVA
jgi:homocysteine S-methyltransferase